MDDFFGTLNQTTSINSNNNLFENDPAADFLAREQAELDKIESISNDLKSSNDNDFFLVDKNSIGIESNVARPAVSVTPNKQDIYSSVMKADKLSQESDKLKQWREEQKVMLANKDAEEEKKKKELKEQARKELDDWYRNRKEQLDKLHLNIKQNEIEQQSTEGGNQWERIAKLVDFNTKFNKNAKDVSRMKNVLLQLKQQPLSR